jgi:hypothetical protein
VGTDVLVDPGTFGQPTYNPGGLVTVHPVTIAVQEDRSVFSVADRQVDGSCCSWSHWDQLCFASFADDPQCVMASFQTDVTNISTKSFRHSQTVKGKKARQRVVAGIGQSSFDQKQTQFVTVQTGHG